VKFFVKTPFTRIGFSVVKDVNFQTPAIAEVFVVVSSLEQEIKKIAITNKIHFFIIDCLIF
jgi:hypothetical protein